MHTYGLILSKSNTTQQSCTYSKLFLTVNPHMQLIEALAKHWLQRYNEESISQWLIEGVVEDNPSLVVC